MKWLHILWRNLRMMLLSPCLLKTVAGANRAGTCQGYQFGNSYESPNTFNQHRVHYTDVDIVNTLGCTRTHKVSVFFLLPATGVCRHIKWRTIKPKSVHSVPASSTVTITTSILNPQLRTSAPGQTGRYHTCSAPLTSVCMCNPAFLTTSIFLCVLCKSQMPQPLCLSVLTLVFGIVKQMTQRYCTSIRSSSPTTFPSEINRQRSQKFFNWGQN